MGHIFQSRRPVNLQPLVVLPDHGLCQTLGRIQPLVAESLLVRYPAFIDRFVFHRHDPVHFVILDVHGQISTQPIVRADRFAARELPAARGVTERFAGQCADRTQIDHVARQFGIHRAVYKAHDLGMLGAVRHSKLHLACDLLTKAHAARALYATAHFYRGNQLADLLGIDHAFFFSVARCASAVSHREILKLTFSALIADRAIQRMIDQQKFHHAFLRLDRHLGMRVHLHAFGRRRRTGRQWFGRFFDFDQAHPAVGCNGQFLVIAKMRDINAGLIRRIHYRGTALGLD